MLWLSWDDSGMSLEPTTEGTRDVHVLEGLRPNQNLKYLHITGYSGATSPTWLDSNVSVTSLKTLHLENCPNLESPRLESCTALEELDIRECEQLAVLDGSQFPCSLRILKIDTVGLESLRLESCTALEELDICGCEQLAVLEVLQYLGSLRSLRIDNVGLKSLRLESCTALEELDICGCEQLVVLDGLQYLGSLRILQIDTIGLESLRLESCTALEELYIYRCEQLAVLDLGSLRSLHIEKNSELEIRDCESLRNLTHLHVRRCPRVQIGGYELCHRLERVSIDDPSVLTTSFCEHLTSLQRLEVWGDEVTRQLTNEEEEVLQLLTSQQEPFFCICSNLVHLPAGLHSLPSLKRLMIYDCKGISRLPEKGLPPSLEKLDIIHCSEELNAHCRMLATSKLKVTISVTVFKALDIKEVMNQPTNSLEQIEEDDG